MSSKCLHSKNIRIDKKWTLFVNSGRVWGQKKVTLLSGKIPLASRPLLGELQSCTLPGNFPVMWWQITSHMGRVPE